MPLSLHLDDATQYATVYDGERPVATVQRRRVREDGPAWKVFIEGREVCKISYHLSNDYVTGLILRCVKLALATT